jgi:pimeloyl-ACP methyl ester carboxylesterase
MATAPVELAHEVRGAGKPLLLIHGTAASVWGRLPDLLGTDHRVIVYDRRGFGRSHGPVGATLEQHAADAAALLEKLGTGPATVIGWSIGGVVALHLAIARSDLVERLVLIEPPLHAKRHPSLPMLRAFMKLMIQRRRNQGAAAETFSRWAFSHRDGGPGFDVLRVDEREAILANAAAILAELDVGTGEDLKRKRIGSIQAPVTLVAGGRSDRAFGKAVERLARALPGPDVEQLAGSGHAVQLEQPDELAAIVRAGPG